MSENILHVYVAEICEKLNIESVYPAERKEEILSCKSDKVKMEKNCVWKLLEVAAKKSFGFDFNELKFEKLPNGKWICDKFCFSLSHSKCAVAVAVSSHPIGVDIEVIKEPKNWGVANKILNDLELAKLNELNVDCKAEYFVLKWTEKESIFKMQNKNVFFSENPKAFNSDVISKKIAINDEQYYVSVACENLHNLQYFEINLNDIQ